MIEPTFIITLSELETIRIAIDRLRYAEQPHTKLQKLYNRLAVIHNNRIDSLEVPLRRIK